MNPLRTQLTIGALLGLALATTALAADEKNSGQAPQPAPPTNDPQLVAAAERYGADAWVSTAARAGLELGQVAVAGLAGGKLTRDASGALVRAYADSNGVDRVLVESATLDTVEAARERHVSTIAFVQSSNRLPTTAELGIEAGDVGHVGRSGAGPGRISWVAFVRGNVHVRVICLDPTVDPHPDLGAIAKSIDGAILAVPQLAPKTKPAHPSVDRLAPAAPACDAGKTIALDFAATDAALVEWSVGGPKDGSGPVGQGYVEKDAGGAWRFHATGRGKVEIDVVVTSSRGTSSAAHAALDVR